MLNVDMSPPFLAGEKVEPQGLTLLLGLELSERVSKLNIATAHPADSRACQPIGP